METWLLKLTAAQINLTLIRAFLIVLLFLFSLMAPALYSQTSGVQPTPVPGSNLITFVSGTNTYRFFHNGILRYEYTVRSGNTTNGGTFNTLKAYDENNTPFLPSNFGGVSAILSGAERVPWDAGVTFDRLSHQIVGGNTVEAYWKMNYGGQYIKYKYKLSIQGRTLIIRVEVDNGYTNAVHLYLDRSENCQIPVEAIAVTYLNLFHI